MNNTETFHRSPEIEKPKKIVRVRCDRCGGSGFYHTHGVCWRCNGTKVDPNVREWAYPAHWTHEQCVRWNHARLERNRKAREARNAKQQTATVQIVEPALSESELRQQTFAENVARCPKLQDVRDAMRVHGVGSAPEFLWSVCDQAFYIRLTDKQIDAFNSSCNLYLINYGD